MTENKQAEPEIRVLLLAPNWLGDAVMFSAMIEFLHNNRILPDGRRLVFDLAVRPAWAPLFKDDERLENILPVERNGRHGGLFGGVNLGNDFRSLKPHAVVLGPPSFRAGLAAWHSGASLRVGYNSDGRGLFLNQCLSPMKRGTLHHSDELVILGGLLLKALGFEDKASDQQKFLPTMPGCKSIAPAVTNSSAPLWVLAPGATYGSAKSWPLNRALDFVRETIEDRAVRLVLLGDAAATVFAQGLAEGLDFTMADQLDGGPGLVDLTGKTDLHQVVSILKASQVFVGNDSGLMHLAAALGVPTVGIFGSSNPHWTSPRGPCTAVVNAEGFSCRPCYLKTCNQKEFCLETIFAPSVFKAIDSLLSDHG